MNRKSRKPKLPIKSPPLLRHLRFTSVPSHLLMMENSHYYTLAGGAREFSPVIVLVSFQSLRDHKPGGAVLLGRYWQLKGKREPGDTALLWMRLGGIIMLLIVLALALFLLDRKHIFCTIDAYGTILSGCSETHWLMIYHFDDLSFLQGGNCYMHISRRTFFAGMAGIAVTGGLIGGFLSYPHPFIHQQNHVSVLAWSPDGKRIASTSLSSDINYEWEVQVWDAFSGAHTQTYQKPYACLGVVWSPDGRFIASGGGDDAVQVWDANNGSNLFTLRSRGIVDSIAWSPDGKYIALGERGGGDRSVEVYGMRRLEPCSIPTMDMFIPAIFSLMGCVVYSGRPMADILLQQVVALSLVPPHISALLRRSGLSIPGGEVRYDFEIRDDFLCSSPSFSCLPCSSCSACFCVCVPFSSLE